METAAMSPGDCISATTTLDESVRTAWDAVVIGAGPAGAFAARELALAGARTLVVDRKPFPRPKVCGACINGHALGVLEACGLGDLVWSLGARPLRQFHVYSRHRTARLALPGGAAVSRDRFDAALVREAIAAGAAFLPGVSAVVGSGDEFNGGEGRGVELKPVAGAQQTRTVRARIILVATGLEHSRCLPSEGFRSRISARSRLGVSAILPAPGDAATFEPGTITMAIGAHGYAGLVRIEGATLNIAAALDPQFVRANHGPAEAVARLLEQAGLPPPAMLASAAWTGTVPLTRRTRPLAADRVFLLGDAAGYVEPFTGEGIGWALSAATAVVPLAVAAIPNWDSGLARRWQAVYCRLIARRQRACRLIAAGLRYPRLTTAVLRALSCSPWVADPLVARISGAPARLKASCP